MTLSVAETASLADGDAMPAVRQKEGLYAWYVCLVMIFGFMFSYMDRTILPLLVTPIEHSFAINDTIMGLLQGAAFAIFYAVLGFPISRIADHANRRNLILCGVVVWCLATAYCGLAQSLLTLFICRVVVATGEAVLQPSAVSILSDYFSPAKRTRALNTYSMGIFLGGGLALAAGGTIIKHLPAGAVLPFLGQTASWRVVFILLGLSGFILVPMLLAVREPRRVTDDGAAVGKSMPMREILAVVASKRAAIFCNLIGFGLISLGSTTMQSWAPTLFVRIHHWTIATAGIRLGIATLILGPLGAYLSSLSVEWFSRRGRTDAKLLVGAMAATGCVFAAFCVTLPWPMAGMIAFFIMQFLTGFNFGLVQAASAELLPNRMRGLAAATFVAFTNLSAAILGPVAVGVLNDQVFHSPLALPISMRIAGPTAYACAALILWLGLKPYRAAITRMRAVAA